MQAIHSDHMWNNARVHIESMHSYICIAVADATCAELKLAIDTVPNVLGKFIFSFHLEP